jgi:hypothetical protein
MSVTPDFIVQIYKDTATGNLWRANSLTAGDWTLEVQNMRVKWTPTSANLAKVADLYENEYYGAFSGSELNGITTLTSDLTVFDGIVQFKKSNNLVSLSFPNLTTFGQIADGLFLIDQCPQLQSVSLPLVVTAPGSPGAGFSAFIFSTNPLLTTINLSSWVPVNNVQYVFSGNALSASTVNSLLARCVANAGFVSGLIDVSGGTSSAPTGQGAADKITLNARQAGLAVTN